MRVCHALAGYRLEVDEQELQWRKPADVVRQRAKAAWELNEEDQILLVSGGGELGDVADEQTPGRDAFVFVRSVLDPQGEFTATGLVLDAPRASDERHPEDELLRLRAACQDPAFEVFHSNVAEARQRLLESSPVAAVASRTEDRLEVQRLAMQSVLDNLSSHRATCGRSMSLLLQKHEKVQEKLDANLKTVEDSMAALRVVELHPALKAEGREVLGDTVPHERINQFSANLLAERSRLGKRVERLRKLDGSTQALCDQVVEKMRQLQQDDGPRRLARAIQEGHEKAESEALPELHGLVPQEGAPPASVLEGERRSAGALENLRRLCASVQELFSELESGWRDRQANFVQSLREVSYVQSKVRDVERQAALLEEEVNAQRGYSLQLAHLRKMPKAYEKMLHEIARRRQFRAWYLVQSEHMKSTLARMVEEENSRRRAFMTQHGCHLPADLLQGLGSGALAPPVVVEVPESSDAALPDIDFASLRDTKAGPGMVRSRLTSDFDAPGVQSSSLVFAPHRRQEPLGSSHSTPSCSSSQRSPQGPAASAKAGSGSVGSSGLGGSSGGGSLGAPKAPSPAPGRGDAEGARSGTDESTRGHSPSDLEARNRHLEARVESLLQELASIRGAAAVSSSPNITDWLPGAPAGSAAVSAANGARDE